MADVEHVRTDASREVVSRGAHQLRRRAQRDRQRRQRVGGQDARAADPVLIEAEGQAAPEIPLPHDIADRRADPRHLVLRPQRQIVARGQQREKQRRERHERGRAIALAKSRGAAQHEIECCGVRGTDVDGYLPGHHARSPRRVPTLTTVEIPGRVNDSTSTPRIDSLPR
jgi:hypothetical protein